MMDCPAGSSPPTDLVTAQDEDRISTLPDHILLHILEHLDLDEAIQTSTLSRRWIHLPCALSRLLIDVARFLPRDRNKREKCTVDQIMSSYTAAVRRLLPLSASSNHGTALRQLQLSFYLRDPYLCSIGRAVGDVMEIGNTTYLEFIVWPDIRHPSVKQCILYGERFMSFFRDCPTAFQWLTGLILNSITFNVSDVHILLSTCSKLEFLSLTSCDSTMDPTTNEDSILKIDAPLSSLLTIEVHNCGYESVNLINAPKLGKLVCTDWIGANPPLSFGNVPHLHSITLCCSALEWQAPFTLSHFLSNITTLSIMYLNFVDQMIWIKPEDPKHLSSVFFNLREVYLYNIFFECDLNWTLFVLEAAPSLSDLYLKLSWHHCERSRCEDSAKKANLLWDEASPHFKHHQLSLLKIVGFAVDEKLLKYIRLIIERARSLKRISLLDQKPCAKCDTMQDGQCLPPRRWRFPAEEENIQIRQQLLDGFSSSIEISIG